MIISRENDVIYELVFPVELLNPVTLNITYTSEGGDPQSRIPDVRYDNTRTITYREIVSQLPYEVYHVSIALIGVDGSQRIVGPPTIRGEIVGMYNNYYVVSLHIDLKWWWGGGRILKLMTNGGGGRLECSGRKPCKYM